MIIEPKSITFEVSNEKEKENQDIEKYIEPLSREVSQPPVDKVVTTKRKETIAPRVMPKRRAKKAKLMDPDFVYRAKVPELKIDDIEVHANLAKTNQDPASYREAIQSEERERWITAIQEELKSIIDNEVWTIIDKPARNLNRQKLNLIDSKWVFKKKIDEKGMEKFKARLVIRGFKDKNSYKLKETYAPVSRLSTIRTALAVINKLDLDAVQLDVKTAFLNGNLEDEIYMEIPDRLEIEGNNRSKVCKLQRTIYGLKTSPKIWNQRFTAEVEKLGLEKDLHEPCLFTWRKKGKVALLILYVYDIILASNCKQKLQEIKNTLCNTFEMKDLEEPSRYLGMEITRDRENRVMKLTQVEYTNKVLERFRMDESKAQNTPMVTRQVKTREIKSKASPIESKQVESIKIIIEKIPYREAIGSLMYLATMTRPDIAYAVNYLSRKQVSPSEDDWKEVKRIFRYLQGTKEIGLMYRGTVDNLTNHTDSSFRDHLDSTSTSGYVIKFFGDPVAWRSHKQTLVTLSTCQAEYLAMSEVTQELISLDKSIRDMLGETKLPAKIWCDNRSTIDCTQMDGCHKLKNFDDPIERIIDRLIEREISGKKKDMADTHGYYVKSCAMEGKLIIEWVNTIENEADIMTKLLPAQSHEYLRDKIMNRSI
uniref:Reverse transcriptase Ty1/copia-type domain-containing protein n=1 Tax=Trichogramma kaykai TaxID=54128 RepID=A0ABD2WAX0_9HYME